MKHTDFYTKCQSIKEHESKELYKALEAHGGAYSWPKTEEEEGTGPVIAISVDSICPYLTDVTVVSAEILKGGYIEFIGEDEYGNELTFCAGDAFAGQLACVIDSIPETDKVTDVTL